MSVAAAVYFHPRDAVNRGQKIVSNSSRPGRTHHKRITRARIAVNDKDRVAQLARRSPPLVSRISQEEVAQVVGLLQPQAKEAAGPTSTRLFQAWLTRGSPNTMVKKLTIVITPSRKSISH